MHPQLTNQKKPKMSKIITLVEDDLDAAVILTDVLVKAGYNVNTMRDGKTIVEQGFALPDIFILDNYIPTIHGVALCKYLKLKSKTNNIPVIIISGSQHIGEKAKEAGASFFLKKPFHAEELLTCIKEILDAHPLSFPE